MHAFDYDMGSSLNVLPLLSRGAGMRSKRSASVCALDFIAINQYSIPFLCPQANIHSTTTSLTR